MEKTRVLVAAPATDFAPTAKTFRHAVALAEGMAASGAQVTVAVRRTGCVQTSSGIGLLAIHQPAGAAPEPDGVAVRGFDVLEHLRYLRALRRAKAGARAGSSARPAQFGDCSPSAATRGPKISR